MKIASAQINTTLGSIQDNLQKHYQMIELAASHKADLILFPEMSITGYCREEGKNLAFQRNDSRLETFRKLSEKHNMIIIAGAPIQIDGKLFIGAFIILPDGKVEIYCKQFLHDGEDVFYDSSIEFNPVLRIKGEIISMVICADIDHDMHPKQAKNNNCSLYLASIFFSRNGMGAAYQSLSDYAKRYSFKVLMSNYCGKHWKLEAGGKSGFWNDSGDLIATLGPEEEGLLLVDSLQNTFIEIPSS